MTDDEERKQLHLEGLKALKREQDAKAEADAVAAQEAEDKRLMNLSAEERAQIERECGVTPYGSSWPHGRR